MKTISLVLIAVCVLLSFTALAQDQPKAEVFGGYQYTRLDADGTGINANGWNGAVTGNLNSWLGVTGDFSGAYATVSGLNTNVYTYTVGPVISARKSAAFTPFAHALFGGFRASAGYGGLSASTNGFAVLAGGGVDARLSDRFAFRVMQADWMMLRAEGSTQSKNIRISSGVVVRF